MPGKVSTARVQLIFLLLQLADVGTTLAVLMNGGIEQNPLVSRFMAIGSLQGLILSKVVVIGAAALAIHFHKWRAIWMANIVFCGIVLWNISVLVRLAMQASSNA
jgi:hypothetical protein